MERQMNDLVAERKECEGQIKRTSGDFTDLRKEADTRHQDTGLRSKKGTNLEQELQARETKIDKLTDILGSKDEVLKELEERIRKMGGESVNQNLYRALKGDQVDELLAKYINLTQCPVPIKRLGNGYYLFGSKKIFAKIMNGKLVIRVGGGFMVIEEFIATYAEQEMRKIQAIEARDAEEEDGTARSKGYGSNRRSPRSGSGVGFGSKSPKSDQARRI
mmetsp:Transcript_42625/g.40907  ORF Transcript_42625/g.40907 Transcript_42625/m.40907 type:complete len:219 (+) Transcript_42625:2167-2823(+)